MTRKLHYFTLCSLLISISFLLNFMAKGTIKKIVHYNLGQDIYIIFFTILLLFLLILLRNVISKSTPLKALMLGAFTGYFCGIISCFIEYNTTTPYGLDITIKMLSRLGVLSIEFFVFTLAPPIFTGSWLTGGVIFFFVNKFSRSTEGVAKK